MPQAPDNSESPADREPKLPLKLTDPISFAQALIDNIELRRFYKARGIHCFDCDACEAETFAEGARVHASGPYGAFDAQKLVDELNELGRKHPFKESTRVEMTLMRRILDRFFAGGDT